MKSLKLVATTLMLITGLFSLNAQCTLTSPCGTFEYTQTSLSVSSSSSNGQTNITVRSGGVVIDNISCSGYGAVSTSCTSIGDDTGEYDNDYDDNNDTENDVPEVQEFNICDYISSPWLKRLLGC